MQQDNASAHRAPETVELLRTTSYLDFFLSPKSPDFNPVDYQIWATM